MDFPFTISLSKKSDPFECWNNEVSQVFSSNTLLSKLLACLACSWEIRIYLGPYMKCIINVMHKSNKTLLLLLLLLKQKEMENNKNVKLVGCLTLFFVKQMHLGCLMAVVAVHWRWTARCSSEIFDETFLFLCFILHNNCPQMYVLPKSDEINKVWLWSEGYYSLVR